LVGKAKRKAGQQWLGQYYDCKFWGLLQELARDLYILLLLSESPTLEVSKKLQQQQQQLGCLSSRPPSSSTTIGR